MAKAETAKPLTKTEIIANIVAATELPKKDVVAVIDLKRSAGVAPMFFWREGKKRALRKLLLHKAL